MCCLLYQWVHERKKRNIFPSFSTDWASPFFSDNDKSSQSSKRKIKQHSFNERVTIRNEREFNDRLCNDEHFNDRNSFHLNAANERAKIKWWSKRCFYFFCFIRSIWKVNFCCSNLPSFEHFKRSLQCACMIRIDSQFGFNKQK